VGYASKALIWHSMREAKAKGFSVYDFGGVILNKAHPAFGITQFKSSFGGYPAHEKNSLVIPKALCRALYTTLKGHR
jgi:lipid II:glycine glycyltransferase (peptidoglycan interpeptide bridge formation enzyme)